MKPLIGITVNYDIKEEIGLITHFGTPGQQWNYIAHDYVNAIAEAGGIPVLLPVYGDSTLSREVAERLDGVLISGGSDVDPRRFGARAKKYCGGVCIPRDDMEFALAKFVLEEMSIPLLGICRGEQVLNIALGGTVYQDLEQEGGYEVHSAEMYPRTAVVHEALLKEGSRIHDIFGCDQVGVNSYHHQGVKDLGEGLIVSATSPDGVVEAIELPGERFVLGVQWHPEMMVESEIQTKIFKAFVEACQR
ncbi:MAG: gamma-glutamyl-gamma-aminobutyrate hydrolase family protein [Firmicutes bacterium]|nr:gamma-glutamyl-gamma-aminobutyrate hydrolase family protein [Bacillota bacterium]